MVPADVPPAFQEASSCAVCGSSFGTFKRRHHCRSCGRSLCNEHSSTQMALPRLGLFTPVRVCKDCSLETSRAAPEAAVSNDSFAALRLSENDESSPKGDDPEPDKPTTTPSSQVECKCGMPLCICSPEPPKEPTPPQPATGSSSHKQKRVAPVPKQTSASTKTSPSLFLNQTKEAPTRTYDISGEGIREAVKNGDASAVKDLLLKGVDPNFTDKQGMSLLHLATVFNFTEIAFILMDAGASAEAKNFQGETPLDCAQTTLQYKLRQRLLEVDT